MHSYIEARANVFIILVTNLYSDSLVTINIRLQIKIKHLFFMIPDEISVMTQDLIDVILWTISNWRKTSLLLATRLCIIVIVITVLCTFRLKVVFNSYGIILSVRASLCQRFIICQNVTNPGSLFRGIQPHYEKKILCLQMTLTHF